MTCKAAPIQDFVQLVAEVVQPTPVAHRVGPVVAYLCPIFWTAGFPMTFLATFFIFKIVRVINYFRNNQTVAVIISVHGTFIISTNGCGPILQLYSLLAMVQIGTKVFC